MTVVSSSRILSRHHSTIFIAFYLIDYIIKKPKIIIPKHVDIPIVVPPIYRTCCVCQWCRGKKKTLAGPSKNIQRSALKISVLAPIAQRDWRRVGPPLPPPPAALISRSRCVVLGSTFKIARLLLYSDGGRQFDLARACAEQRQYTATPYYRQKGNRASVNF